MKRLLLIFLACLLLTGCAEGSGETSPSQPDTTAQSPTEPAGSYLQNSELELSTGGAVRVYAPDFGEITHLRAVGEDLLVFTGTETTTVTRLTGENLFRVAQVELDQLLLPESPSLYISQEWFIYFHETSNDLVYLDENLEEIRRLAMPEDLEGYPVLTSDRKNLYYCTAEGVRCMELDSGISRLIKEMHNTIQTVADVVLDDSVVVLYVSDGVSETETVFLDAKTGGQLNSLTEDMQLKFGEEYVYAVDTEGLVEQMIFGRAGEEIRQLIPQNYLDSGVFLENVHGAVICTQNGLDYYGLETGTRTATLALRGLQPEDITTGGNGYVYFRSGNTLLRWDLAATPTADETVYTGTWYNRDDPDRDGLKSCEDYAAQLSQRHGITVLIGDSAAQCTTQDYSPVAEYQTEVIMDGLSRLEQMLKAFPQGFFETAVEGFEDGSVTVCLVRDLPGSYESGSLESVESIQFWQEGHAYVSLAMGDTLEKNFFHQIFHVLESRVLSETIAYYRWDELNPKDFRYDNDYETNKSRDGSKYMDAKSRSFIDTFSMSFPTEDRATVMAYACMEGNEAYFSTYIMQQKLHTLCVGIREAYGLEDSTQIFLWEQYLETSLAPEV